MIPYLSGPAIDGHELRTDIYIQTDWEAYQGSLF